MEESENSVLKLSPWDPSHDLVSEKINQAVDDVAVERELEIEDEDQLIAKKKEQLKNWFINNFPK